MIDKSYERIIVSTKTDTLWYVCPASCSHACVLLLKQCQWYLDEAAVYLTRPSWTHWPTCAACEYIIVQNKHCIVFPHPLSGRRSGIYPEEKQLLRDSLCSINIITHIPRSVICHLSLKFSHFKIGPLFFTPHLLLCHRLLAFFSISSTSIFVAIVNIVWVNVIYFYAKNH